eukprot:3207463-Amphidinium_carterae.1
MPHKLSVNLSSKRSQSFRTSSPYEDTTGNPVFMSSPQSSLAPEESEPEPLRKATARVEEGHKVAPKQGRPQGIRLKHHNEYEGRQK